jgi:hypothetical protein
MLLRMRYTGPVRIEPDYFRRHYASLGISGLVVTAIDLI